MALGLLGPACGDRAGDPVVALGPISEPPSGHPDSGSPGAAGAGPSLDPGGLCAGCDSSDDCGEGDLCLHPPNGAAGETWFCGRHCFDDHDCPDGYHCMDVDHSDRQCIPENTDCRQVVSDLAEPLDVMRVEALLQLNELRAQAGLPEFTSSDCLHGLAQQSAEEYRRTNNALGVFERECEGLSPDRCECHWSAQAERNVVEFALTWQEAVEESILDRAFRDPDGAFVRHVTNPAHVNVGFGIVLSGDEAWTAISFGR